MVVVVVEEEEECVQKTCDVCYICVCHFHVWERFVCLCAHVNTCVCRPEWSRAQEHVFHVSGGWCLCPHIPRLFTLSPRGLGSLVWVSCVSEAPLCVWSWGWYVEVVELGV